MTPAIYLAIGLAAGVLLSALAFLIARRRSGVDEELVRRLEDLAHAQEREEKALRDEFSRSREETAVASKAQREELSGALQRLNETTVKSISDVGAMLKTPIENVVGQTSKMSESNEQRLEALRSIVDTRLKQLQEDNSRQLDRMRVTVDEKLQGTLEKRLGESFKLVSERLEQVHQGLGAMQQLASDVGGLQRVLTNVKTRGGWGEVQLGALLEQVLTPDQFERNVRTRDDSGETVEFAIRLPGDGNGDAVWLPIDAKFPVEDYQRLIAAQESADLPATELATRQLETQLRKSAKDICSRYINPPKTTDFALMFLPTEGLYAEAIRRVGLVEQVQRDCRVVITGPTTLAALLNSLQMGFRTLSIQQRSSEVWNLLAAVKTEFGKFGEALTKVKDKLDQASSDMDKVATRSRVITKKLRDVEELPTNPEPLLPELLSASGDEE
ncbi:MAG TPA: DNA recombination protein RmuC [Chthoniobacterales bacterium]|nr:DNA recombination protein RmuC [Chthoniobacterales bacterium]